MPHPSHSPSLSFSLPPSSFPYFPLFLFLQFRIHAEIRARFGDEFGVGVGIRVEVGIRVGVGIRVEVGIRVGPKIK